MTILRIRKEQQSINEKGLTLLKQSEGCKLHSYQDSVGVWTIGYGHTANAHEGQTINQQQADAFLKDDIKWCENLINTAVTVPLTSNQFSALVVFTFNVGAQAFSASTLRHKLNDGDYAGAAMEFPRWDKAGGKVLPGLEKRRKAEQLLFLDPA